MKKLTQKQILMMHKQLVEQTGGSDNVLNYDLLDSALENPFQTFDGEELYPSIQEKAARLGYGLIKNHCMEDGNKRIGAHTMLVFLALNGIELQYTQKELYEIILDIAASKKECPPDLGIQRHMPWQTYTYKTLTDAKMKPIFLGYMMICAWILLKE